MLRVRTVFTGVAGLPGYSNLFFNGSATGNLQGLIDAVEDFWAGMLEFSDDACIARVEPDVAVVNEVTGQITSVLTGAAGATGGQNTGALLPTVVQGLLRYTSNVFVNGRNLQGRVFVPCLAQAAGPTVPAGPTQVDWSGAGNQLISASATVGNPWVVWSKTHGISSPTVSVSVAGQYSVLRSRRD